MTARREHAVAWWALPVDEVTQRLGVDLARGLTRLEAERRLAADGPNAIAEEEPEPIWKQFLKHYRDYMQIVLVVAAIVSLLIGEWGTAVGLALLTLFNAWLGYHQEGKAQAAAAALGRDDEGGRQGAPRGRVPKSPPTSSYPVTSCCSTPETGCRRMAGSWSPRRCRSRKVP